VGELPRGVGTSTPREVATATAEAIVRDRGEVDVAPAPVRFAGLIGSISPELTGLLNRRTGAGDINRRISG
jgi:hypothetical protein